MLRKTARTSLALCVLTAATLSFAQTSTTASAPSAPASTTAATTAPARRAKVGIIHLTETLTERPESFSLSALLGSGKAPALSTLMTTLNAAAKDSTLSGIVLDLSSFSLTLNQAQEIGAMIKTLRSAGKRVAVYSADFDTDAYILASYADTIIMPENGDVLVPGTGLQMIFFAGTLEKLHMTADFVQVGKFKGAEEPFTRKTASPEYRQQIEKLVDGMYTQIINTIATNRPNMTEAQVKKAIDEGWFTGRHAKELGLVDQTITRDKLENWINAQFKSDVTLVDDYGSPRKESIDLSSPLAIFSLLGASDKPRQPSGPGIAVIYATGEIMPDTSVTEDSTDYVTPSTMRRAVKKALDDDRVRAIVLRVDSPGGSAAASDEIWSVLKEADKRKPVTVSMGRVAASGGYYISCAGRSITADPATITGSIGVVSGKIVIKGALDWAGINIEPVERGQHAEMLSMLRPFTDEEREFLKKTSEEVYGVFTSRVKAARGEKVAQLEEVAQGRLFTGQQAKEAGLVDDVGTLNDAIRSAARTARLGENYQVIILPETKTFADILREGLMSDVKAPLGAGALPMSAAGALIESLPAEVRTPTRRALQTLQLMQRDRVLLEMPAGIVETH